MKQNVLKIGIALSILILISCGNDDATKNDYAAKSDDKNETSENHANCPGENKIDFIKYDDAEQVFDQKDVYTNFSDMHKSYRLLFLS